MKITGDNAADKSYNDPDIGGRGRSLIKNNTMRLRRYRRRGIDGGYRSLGLGAVIQVCWSVLWIADPAAMNAELQNRSE